MLLVDNHDECRGSIIESLMCRPCRNNDAHEAAAAAGNNTCNFLEVEIHIRRVVTRLQPIVVYWSPNHNPSHLISSASFQGSQQARLMICKPFVWCADKPRLNMHEMIEPHQLFTAAAATVHKSLTTGSNYCFPTCSFAWSLACSLPSDRGETAVSYRWTSWVWEITSWSSRL